MKYHRTANERAEVTCFRCEWSDGPEGNWLAHEARNGANSDPMKFACRPFGLLELSGGETVATLTGKEMLFMSCPEVPKISLKAVERKRGELDSQRALLHRTLRDAPNIEEMMDVFRALETTLHSLQKNAAER